MPEEELTSSIEKSLIYYSESLSKHMQSHNVDLNCIKGLKLHVPAEGRKYMWAKDDRGKEFRIYVSEKNEH
jgi:hypothetical protein